MTTSIVSIVYHFNPITVKDSLILTLPSAEAKEELAQRLKAEEIRFRLLADTDIKIKTPSYKVYKLLINGGYTCLGTLQKKMINKIRKTIRNYLNSNVKKESRRFMDAVLSDTNISLLSLNSQTQIKYIDRLPDNFKPYSDKESKNVTKQIARFEKLRGVSLDQVSNLASKAAVAVGIVKTILKATGKQELFSLHPRKSVARSL